MTTDTEMYVPHVDHTAASKWIHEQDRDHRLTVAYWLSRVVPHTPEEGDAIWAEVKRLER